MSRIFVLVGAVLLSMTKAWRVGEIVFFLPWVGLLMLTAGVLVHDIIIRPRRSDRFGTAALACLAASATGFLFFVGFLAVLFVPLGVVFDQNRRRVGLGVLGVIALMGLSAAIAVPSFKSARQRANTRACYANQKTIAGAMEMYNLDKCTKRTSWTVLSSQPSRQEGTSLRFPKTRDPAQEAVVATSTLRAETVSGV